VLTHAEGAGSSKKPWFTEATSNAGTTEAEIRNEAGLMAFKEESSLKTTQSQIRIRLAPVNVVTIPT